MRCGCAGACRLPAFDHQKGAHQYGCRAGELERQGVRLAKERHGQEDREDGARLVDGDDLVDVTHRERLEVADPACACGDAREREEDPRRGVDGAKGSRLPCHRCHEPREGEHHDGSDCRRHVGVGTFDAELGEDCGHACEERRACRCQKPHERSSPTCLHATGSVATLWLRHVHGHRDSCCWVAVLS